MNGSNLKSGNKINNFLKELDYKNKDNNRIPIRKESQFR